jgi:Zn-dependent metalloprotease
LVSQINQMKKNIFIVLMIVAVQSLIGQVDAKLFTYTQEVIRDKQNRLNFLTFRETPQVTEAQIPEFINSMIFANSANKVSVFKMEKDEYGFTHTKYNIVQNGIPVVNKVIIAHAKNGVLTTLNGDIHPFNRPSNQFSLTEKAALKFALKKINAKKYKWENKIEEEHTREVYNQPGFTYYPKGEKVIYERNGKVLFAYKFDIYAEVPLYRSYVYVDATSGKILGEQNLICNIDVPGSGSTKYSGTQTITCDVTGGVYSLKEVQRGLGVETYNLKNTANYAAATNFTNSVATWTNWGSVATASNQGALDAHWGAEKTYDYFIARFNRNSIDNAGYKLRSYVHYNNNFNNAFWDGIRMTYGDGNGTVFTILTCLDVCGHEITHGLVSNTAGLGGTGTDESDALNESFADIFGTSIERYAKPSTWNWILGRDITPNNLGIRNMQNPKQLQDPDTYSGQYWDPAGQPHNNAGPCDKWFYLLVTGGAATNDLGNAYNVTGIGNVDAEKIAYRALTVYFVPNTNYAAARVAAIQAAKDLFGNCSNQVQQTARAWYAVGVGSNFSNSVVGTNFQASVTNFCTLPAVVNFNNTTVNGQTYFWSFGDGATATTTNAVHTYTNSGTYTVKLKATGCNNIADSLTMPSLITINVPASPTASDGLTCGDGQVTLSASGTGFMSWYANPFSSFALGTGSSFVTPILNSTTTFYVSNTISNSPVIGGKTNFTGGSNLNNNTQFLVFDVLQNSTLNSVLVFASGSGARTVELRNATGVLNSTTFMLSAGLNTLALNYSIPTGTAYQLGLSNSSASNLYRSTSAFSFPYNIGGCVNITGSSNGFYYFFYSWSVTKADCVSPAVAVTASVVALPVVSVSAPVNIFCVGEPAVTLTGNPPGGTLSGQNISGGQFVPTLAGVSTVFYSYSDANGCSDSSSISMNVAECTSINSKKTINSGINIFPNPATDQVVIKNEMGELNISILDASGRQIYAGQIANGEEKLNLRELVKGFYIISVTDRLGKAVTSLKLIKE